MQSKLFDLSQKVALVTGGNGGIGLGLATGLAKHGATVIAWGRNEDKNAQAAKTLSEWSDKNEVRQVDVTDENSIRQEIDYIISKFGRLDSVFANAAKVHPPKRFVKQDQQFWDDIFHTNVWSVRILLQHAAAHMIERAKAGDPGGSLISTGSIAGLQASTAMDAYAVSKAAITSLMKHLAEELAPFGVTANTLIPGFIKTGLTDDYGFPESVVKAVTGRTPMNRWGVPDDFQAIAVYLASDASRFHTADQIVIDGGFSQTVI